MKLRVADLFSGCGGFSIGLEATKLFSIEYAFDNWKPAADVYMLNHKNTVFEQLDLSDRHNIEHVVEKLSGNVDVVVGGPPCQGFSTLGKRRDDDKRSTLVDVFAEIAVRVQPMVILMENVRGIASKKHPSGGTFLESFYSKLSTPGFGGLVGYQVSHRELLATEFGMAQTRKRVITVAVRNDVVGSSNVLEKIWAQVEASRTEITPTLRDVIGDLEATPPIFKKESDTNSQNANAHLSMNHSEKLRKRFSHVPQGGGLLDVPEELLTPHLRRMVSGHYGSGGHVKNIYGRLTWDRPCGTILAGMDKITCGRYVHPDADRLLTPRECARIQSFPDSFELIGGQVSRYYVVGNAVPPKLAEVLGCSVGRFVQNEIESTRKRSAA